MSETLWENAKARLWLIVNNTESADDLALGELLELIGPAIVRLARTGQVTTSVLGHSVEWAYDWPAIKAALAEEMVP